MTDPNTARPLEAPADDQTAPPQEGDLGRADGNAEAADGGRCITDEHFGHLVEQHRTWLLHVAEPYRGRAVTAEDLVQEGIWAAYRNLHKLRKPSGARAWLARFVRYAGLKAAEKHRTRAELMESYAVTREQEYADSPEEIMERRMRNEALDRAIDRLPAGMRAVINCRRDGLSVRATARQLDMPEGTVKCYTSRGIKALREAMRQA